MPRPKETPKQPVRKQQGLRLTATMSVWMIPLPEQLSDEADYFIGDLSKGELSSRLAIAEERVGAWTDSYTALQQDLPMNEPVMADKEGSYRGVKRSHQGRVSLKDPQGGEGRTPPVSDSYKTHVAKARYLQGRKR